MNVDLELLRNLVALVSALLSIGAVIYVVFTSASKKNTEKLGEHDERLLKLELEIQHLPTKEGQHEMQVVMTEMAGEIKQLVQAQRTTQRTVDRMEEALSTRGEK